MGIISDRLGVPSERQHGVLRPSGDDDQGTDFILEEDATSCWITIDNISVYVRRTDEGVAVDLYPLGQEMEDALVGTWALFSEAQEVIDDCEQYQARHSERSGCGTGSESEGHGLDDPQGDPGVDRGDSQ